MGAVLAREEFICRAMELKAEGKVLVFTNGIFDILHVGHARYLAAARALGDVLLVGVNGDSSARSLKGAPRPILPELERAELVAALGVVDYVTIFDEPTAEELVRVIEPDIYAKGGDYFPQGGKELPEAKAVASFGGQVKILPLYPGHSTSEILARIQRAYAQANTQS